MSRLTLVKQAAQSFKCSDETAAFGAVLLGIGALLVYFIVWLCTH